MKKVFLILFLVFIASCNKKTEKVAVTEVPEIDSSTQTEILIWSWDVAAKGIAETVASFNEKYPNIKVNIVDIGYTGHKEKYSVVLRSGEAMPDIFMLETANVSDFAEGFPNRLYNVKDSFYEDWAKDMDPSQMAYSTDSVGRIIAVPWDTGPVVLFYREDLLKEAGIDPSTIVDWNDFIEAGKKFQEVMPDKKMVAYPHTKNAAYSWDNMNTSMGVFPLDENNEIAINDPRSLEALELVRQMVRKDNLVYDAATWDTLVRSLVDERVATFIIGGWWIGTLLDEAPEQAGKWKIMLMPSMPGHEGHSGSQGGSTLLVSSEDPVKTAASLAFIENALLNSENQIMMYENYGLIPSYLPSYEDKRMQVGNEYYGGQVITEVFQSVIANMPPDTSKTVENAVLNNLHTVAYEYATTTDEDLKKILDDIALQMEQSTSHKRAFK